MSSARATLCACTSYYVPCTSTMYRNVHIVHRTMHSYLVAATLYIQHASTQYIVHRTCTVQGTQQPYIERVAATIFEYHVPCTMYRTCTQQPYLVLTPYLYGYVIRVRCACTMYDVRCTQQGYLVLVQVRCTSYLCTQGTIMYLVLCTSYLVLVRCTRYMYIEHNVHRYMQDVRCTQYYVRVHSSPTTRYAVLYLVLVHTSTQYNVQGTCVHSTMYIVQGTMYKVHVGRYYVRSSRSLVRCTMYYVQGTQYKYIVHLHSTMYIVQGSATM